MKKTKRIAFLSLVLAVLMTVSVLPLSILAATDEKITATENWYKSDKVLYVNNAKDLWAFAEELQNGTHHFQGQTVKLTADITANENFNAFLETVTAPTNVWPLTTYDKKFAGTFDGQGHTISGLYVTGSGEGVGIFGNVGTGTKATVKNVNIVNSYVTSSAAGGVGGIFGEVDNETTTTVYDDSHINATKATVSGVYAEINVVCTGTGGPHLGTGGIIGGARADVEITNTTFAGKVTSGVRGAAAFVGSIRPYQGTHPDTAVSANFYRTHLTIKNSVADAKIAGNASASFAGALVGYTNAATIHTFENVFSACTITGTTASQLGVLVGGSYYNTGIYKNRDGVTEDWQEFYFNNVHYLELSGVSNVIGNGTAATAQKVCNAEYYPHADKAGVVDAVVDTVEGSLQQSLTLKNNLSLNVYATILDPNASVTIDGNEVTSDAGRYTLNDIRPQQMMDNFLLEIKQDILGETVVIRKYLSVRKYAEAFWEADFTTEKEKDLIADLLRYGATAQEYTDYNYREENLATVDMELDGYGSNVVAENIQSKYEKKEDSSDYMFTGASLRMDNSIEMRLKFKAADVTGVTVTVSLNKKTKTFDAEDFTKWGSYYVVVFDKIYAHEMETAVQVTMQKGGQKVAELTYSVADYCKSLLAQDSTGDEQLAMEQKMVTAMYAYGLSAIAYNDENRLVIIDGSVSDYVVVYDDANATYKEMAWNFARELRAKTGVMLPVVADTEANCATEIIIGTADGRSESTTVYNTITLHNGNRYGSRSAINGTDIVVTATTDGLLQEAVNDLLDEIRTHGSDTWGIEKNYSAQIDLPAYSTSGSQKVYYAEENNHTLSVTGTSKTEYDAYVAKLEENGFVPYTTNQIGDNIFGTYIKNVNGCDMVAHTAYYPLGTGYKSNYSILGNWHDTNTFHVRKSDGTISQNNSIKANVRITYGPLDFLPDKDVVDVKTSDIRVTPSITQPARWSAYMSASGMCYIIQLVDGRFILIDGGYNSGDVTTYKKDGDTVVQDSTQAYDDAKAIYELLVEMSPDEKPVIATWIISHGHGDHTGLVTSGNGFLDRFHDKVDVEMVAYNDPNLGTATMGDGSTISCKSFVAKFDKYYSDIEHWVVHTGQKLYLPGCDIEIFFTPEDFYGIYDSYTFDNGNVSYSKGACYFENGNETSIAFRVTLGETTFMVTGDSEVENCTIMGTRYQDALQSDILQTPHHGLNGPETGFYQYVDPKTVLWSIDEFRCENDARCNGYSGTSLHNNYIQIPSSSTKVDESYGIGSSTYANGWLKTSQWNRNGTTGDREICAVSATKSKQIFCPFLNDFVIETPNIPFGI